MLLQSEDTPLFLFKPFDILSPGNGASLACLWPFVSGLAFADQVMRTKRVHPEVGMFVSFCLVHCWQLKSCSSVIILYRIITCCFLDPFQHTWPKSIGNSPPISKQEHTKWDLKHVAQKVVVPHTHGVTATPQGTRQHVSTRAWLPRHFSGVCLAFAGLNLLECHEIYWQMQIFCMRSRIYAHVPGTWSKSPAQHSEDD